MRLHWIRFHVDGLKEAKGYRGAIRTNYKKANEAVKKAMAYAFLF